MKKNILILALTFLTFVSYAQTPVFVDKSYSLLSPMTILENDFKIGLVKKGDQLFILLERKLSEKERFLKNETDSSHINKVLELKTYGGLVKRAGKSYSAARDQLQFNAANPQPKIISKNEVVLYILPENLSFDLKNQCLSEIKIIENGGSMTIGAGTYGSIGAMFFITHSSKITAKKGSFCDISKFKMKKIPMYSLMNKNENFVISKIGSAKFNKKTVFGYMLGFENDDAYYSIAFKDSLSIEIIVFPKCDMKYIGELFYLDKYPFEIDNCNCGQYVTEDISATDEAWFRNTFKDGSTHSIRFFRKDRILEKVVAKCDRCLINNGRFYSDYNDTNAMNEWWKKK